MVEKGVDLTEFKGWNGGFKSRVCTYRFALLDIHQFLWVKFYHLEIFIPEIISSLILFENLGPRIISLGKPSLKKLPPHFIEEIEGYRAINNILPSCLINTSASGLLT